MDNPKIEKKKTEIARTEAKIAELKNRLREQKAELTVLENDEIVALYRKENFSEDEFFALLRSQKKERREPAAKDNTLRYFSGQEEPSDASINEN